MKLSIINIPFGEPDHIPFRYQQNYCPSPNPQPFPLHIHTHTHVSSNPSLRNLHTTLSPYLNLIVTKNYLHHHAGYKWSTWCSIGVIYSWGRGSECWVVCWRFAVWCWVRGEVPEGGMWGLVKWLGHRGMVWNEWELVIKVNLNGS